MHVLVKHLFFIYSVDETKELGFIKIKMKLNGSVGMTIITDTKNKPFLF